MNKKIYIYVSTITGNAKKLETVIRQELKRKADYDEVDTPQDADLVIVCFWCRRSSMDDRSLQFVDQLQDKQILTFGTMGGAAYGAYGERVRGNARDYINKKNNCLGVFCCQGKIAVERTERRRTLPSDHKHYLDDAGYLRHVASRSHPDEKDLLDAAVFLNNRLCSIWGEE